MTTRIHLDPCKLFSSIVLIKECQKHISLTQLCCYLFEMSFHIQKKQFTSTIWLLSHTASSVLRLYASFSNLFLSLLFAHLYFINSPLCCVWTLSNHEYLQFIMGNTVWWFLMFVHSISEYSVHRAISHNGHVQLVVVFPVTKEYSF